MKEGRNDLGVALRGKKDTKWAFVPEGWEGDKIISMKEG